MVIVEVRLKARSTGKETILQTVVIDNQGTSEDGNRADYRVRVLKKGMEWLDLRYGKEPIRTGMVEQHPRKSKPILNLIYKALVACGYDK